MFRRPWSAFIAIALLGLSLAACDGSKRDFQDKVDDGTTYLSLLAQTLIEFFQNNLDSCGDFLEIVNALSPDFQECRNGPEGVFRLIRSEDPVCIDGSPLKAVVKFRLEQAACADENDILIDGTTDFTLNFSGEGNIVNLASSGVMINGLLFEFSDFTLKLNFVNTSLNCSGSLKINGDECRISSNCQGCRF